MINNQVQKTMLTEPLYDSDLLTQDFIVNKVSGYLLKNNQEKIIIDLLNEYKINILKDELNHLSKDNLIVILDIMTKNGYLIKEEHGVLNSCPKCDTIIMKAKCTECGSDNVSPNRQMIHSSCGHINDYRKFITEKGLRCPSCGHVHDDSQEIKYEKEFKFCDIVNRCNDCGTEHKHHKMDNSHSCPNCNKKSKIKNMNKHHFLVFSNFK